MRCTIFISPTHSSLLYLSKKKKKKKIFIIIWLKSFLFAQKVNLSGCPQITLAILLLSLLPSSYSIDPTLRKSVKDFTMNFGRLEREQCPISQGLPMLSFESVQEVDISKCPRLHLEAAITCFSKSFPSIRTLKAAYLLNFKTTTLHQLVQKCPLLCEVDLTIDISPLIPAQVSVASSSAAIAPLLSNKSVSVREHPEDVLSLKKSGLLLSNITKLTLEGRTDLCGEIMSFCKIPPKKFCHIQFVWLEVAHQFIKSLYGLMGVEFVILWNLVLWFLLWNKGSVG